MCGIAGLLGHPEPGLAVQRMIECLRHRGPDDSGVFQSADGRIAIGNTRLSIIDLSLGGHQPMSYGDGRLRIVFNGEIYNYRELRAELQKAGLTFRSASDTEVVLAAYSQWGTDAVRRLRGMFAFALYDCAPARGAPTLVLARDRLGIKPLLYAEPGSALVFASELRALVASGLVSRQLDARALLDFFAVGAIFQPRTILAGVRALPPGSLMEVRDGTRRIVPYWDLHDATAGLRRDLRVLSFESAVDGLGELALGAARCSMVADVPVGAFLSGGVDSTAVVGLMGAASGARIHTFCVGFEGSRSVADERRYARLAAEHLGARHEEVVVTAAEAADVFPKLVDAIDQPSLDGANTWLVSRAAGAYVKVAVSGLGGDELFAGYPHFRWMAGGSRSYRNGSRTLAAIGGVLSALGARRLGAPVKFRYGTPPGRLTLMRRLLDDQALERDVHRQWSSDASLRLRRFQERFLRDDADGVQQASYAEIRGYLLSTLLRDGDAMSMAHSLEVRPLLLDHPLVEFVYALPAALKVRRHTAKELLVRAAAEHIPPVIRDRPKVGFEMPFVDWMRGPLRQTVRQLLHGSVAVGLFERRYLEGLRRRLARRDPPRELWAWAILIAWCESQGVELGSPLAP